MTDLSWYPVLRFPLEQNLLPFLRYLEQQHIRHHVTEEDGQQQLWIAEAAQLVPVAHAAACWAEGNLEIEPVLVSPDSAPTADKWAMVLQLLGRVPISLLSIFLGFLGALAIFADPVTLRYAEPFLYQPIMNGRFLPLSAVWEAGQYWRLLTPIFLHFGFLHILFNGMILWEVGRRIEIAKSSGHFFFVVIATGLLSNAAQYWVQADTVFGGLSGVVYGVIGYVAVYQQCIYHPVLQFNKAAIVFFIVWLLLGVFGVIDLFIDGSIANAAHVAGLIAGGLLGGTMVLIDRSKR